jgi:hypothetical protein
LAPPPPPYLHLHLPLRTISDEYCSTTAHMARAKTLTRNNIAAVLVKDFSIGKQDMAVIYMSPNLYHESFLQTVDLRNFDLLKHPTAGLKFYESGQRLHLRGITPSTPAAKIPDWRSQIHGAWLIKVNDTEVATTEDVAMALWTLAMDKRASVSLLFLHPEIRPNLSKRMASRLCLPPCSPPVHMIN